MGSILTSLFGSSGSDAYEKLAKEIQQGMAARKQYEGSAENALSPYMGDPTLQNQYEKTLSGRADSQSIINKILNGYSESPYAKFLTKQGMGAIQNKGAYSGF